MGETEYAKHGKANNPLYCPPPGGVQLAFVASLVKEHFRKHPEDATFGAAPIIIDELKHFYPCS